MRVRAILPLVFLGVAISAGAASAAGDNDPHLALRQGVAPRVRGARLRRGRRARARVRVREARREHRSWDSRSWAHLSIALDNDFATWQAFRNNAWPAKYLFDAQGRLVKRWVGEGSYGAIEAEIRRLLVAASPGTKLPPISPEATAFTKVSWFKIALIPYDGAHHAFDPRGPVFPQRVAAAANLTRCVFVEQPDGRLLDSVRARGSFLKARYHGSQAGRPRALPSTFVFRPYAQSDFGRSPRQLLIERGEKDILADRILPGQGRSQLDRVVTAKTVIPRQGLGPSDERLSDCSPHEVRPLAREAPLCPAPSASSSTPRRTARAKAAATSARLTIDVATAAASSMSATTSFDLDSVMYRFTIALASR